MSDERKDAKNSKGDVDMGYALKNTYKKKHTPEKIKVSNYVEKNLYKVNQQ